MLVAAWFRRVALISKDTRRPQRRHKPATRRSFVPPTRHPGKARFAEYVYGDQPS
jgi:hypothetical protein